MDIEELRDYCLSLKNSTECFPFDEVSLVFKVEGKMFGLMPLDSDDPHISVKCSTQFVDELRDHFNAVEPAFHFNKKYWNQVSLQGDIDDKLILSLIDHSYEEVIKKFTRKLKKEYDEIP